MKIKKEKNSTKSDINKDKKEISESDINKEKEEKLAKTRDNQIYKLL